MGAYFPYVCHLSFGVSPWNTQLISSEMSCIGPLLGYANDFTIRPLLCPVVIGLVLGSPEGARNMSEAAAIEAGIHR